MKEDGASRSPSLSLPARQCLLTVVDNCAADAAVCRWHFLQATCTRVVGLQQKFAKKGDLA